MYQRNDGILRLCSHALMLLVKQFLFCYNKGKTSCSLAFLQTLEIISPDKAYYLDKMAKIPYDNIAPSDSHRAKNSQDNIP